MGRVTKLIRGMSRDTNENSLPIFTSNADDSFADWTTYSNTAQRLPVTGAGGSPTVTFTRSTSSPIEGPGSWIFTKDAVNRQGQGASRDFTIDPANRAKVLQIELDYQVVSGAFVAGTNTTDSDLIVYLYDVTNATLIEPSSIKLLSNSTTLSDRYRSTFQTSATGATFRLIIHCATASNLAYVVKFDNISVSPSRYVYGTPVTDWQTFTPTLTSTTGSITNRTITGRWRRVGSNSEVVGRISFSASSAAFSDIIVSTPPGQTIDTGNIANLLGEVGFNDAGATVYPGQVSSLTSTTLVLYPFLASGTYSQYSTATNAVPFTFGAADSVDFKYSIPVTGWSSSVQMSDQADSRVVAVNGSGNPNNTITGTLSKATWAATPIGNDTHGAWSTANNFYVVPVSGYYHIKFSTEINQTTVLGNSAQGTIVHRNSAGTILNTRSGFDRAFGTGTTSQYTIVETQFLCNVGDTIEFQTAASGTAATYLSAIAGTSFNIERVAGPSAIAASEKIYAEYTTSAGQAMGAGVSTRINYGTKIRDSHNAVTVGASWVFTSPRAEVYEIEACFAGAAQAAASQKILSLFKNGVEYRRLARDRNTAASADDQPAWGATSLYLLAGETIDIRGLLSTAQNLTTADLDNWVTIKSHGGV